MEKDYHQIDTFLNGEMPEQEQADFEKRLQTDQILQQDLDWVKSVRAGLPRYKEQKAVRNLLELTQVELEESGVFDEFRTEAQAQEQVIIKGIAKAERQSFKKDLQGIAGELEIEGKLSVAAAPKPKLRRLIMRVSIAAVVAVLVLAGLFYFPQQNNIQAYFKPFDNALNQEIELVLSEEGAAFDRKQLQDLQKGLTAYHAEQYAQAIPLFKAYLSASTNPYKIGEVQLYLANAYLATSASQQAIELLKPMQSATAQWYLALAYIQKGENHEATPLLQKLKENPEYQEKANELLRGF